MAIKSFALHRHVYLIKRILHHIIGVQLVHLADNHIHVRLMRLREQEEFGTGQSLEALEAEVLALENLEAGVRNTWRLDWV